VKKYFVLLIFILFNNVSAESLNTLIVQQATLEKIELAILKESETATDWSEIDSAQKAVTENSVIKTTLFSDIESPIPSTDKEAFKSKITMKASKLKEKLKATSDYSSNYAIYLTSAKYILEVDPNDADKDYLNGVITVIERASPEVRSLINDVALPEITDGTVSSWAATKPIELFIKGNYFTKEIIQGQALSALYQPLRTNLNNKEYVDITESDTFKKFDIKYGNLRKALLIANSDVAVTQFEITGTANNFKIATLEDLIKHTDREKLLIVDTNYYDKKTLELLFPTVTTTTTSKIFDFLGMTAHADWDWFTTFLDKPKGNPLQLPSADEILPEISEEDLQKLFVWWYKSNFDLNISPFQQKLVTQSTTLEKAIKKNVIYNMKDPNSEISTLLGIAVMRDLYLDTALSNNITPYTRSPVFMSSPKKETGNSYYNYILLKNIENKNSIRYSSMLDMTAPLFIDIYGNIVSESGTVIIPMACNGSYHKKANILTTGFLLNYNDNAYIEDTQGIMNKFSDYIIFKEIESLKDVPIISDNFSLNPIELTTDMGKIDTSKLNCVDGSVQDILYNISLTEYTSRSYQESFNVDESILRVNLMLNNIIFQCVRGQSIFNINYFEENLLGEKNYSKSVLSQALKLENLLKSLQGVWQNTMLTIPNLAFMEGIEYVIFFVYKIILIVLILNFCFQVYLSAIKYKLNFITFLKILISSMLVISFTFLLPILFEYTYYNANKFMLQDESLTMALLNEEKKANNIELGIVNMYVPSIDTELLLEVSKVNLNWFKFVSDVVYSTEIKSLDQVYEAQIVNNLESSAGDYEAHGSSIYYPIDKLFKSSEVYTDYTTHKLQQIVLENNPISFRLPYYAMLDYILYQINSYNSSINSYAYSKFNYDDGRFRSSGIIERYFKSAVFNLTRSDALNHPPDGVDLDVLSQAVYDKTGIFQFYEITDWDNRSIFKDYNVFKNSAWYDDDIIEEEIVAKVNELDEIAIKWIRSNSSLIGRVSDENFLKAFALYMSLKYNDLFKVDGPKSLEIYNLSNDDLLRLSIANTQTVIEESPYSVAKFILNVSNVLGVYMGALLAITFFNISWIKPIATIVVFISLISAVFIQKLLLNKSNEVIFGFIKMTIIMILLNFVHAGLLKFSIFLPNTGLSPFMCIIFSSILHTFYISAIVALAVMSVKHWSDAGNSKLSVKVNKEVEEKHLVDYLSKYSESDEYREIQRGEYDE